MTKRVPVVVVVVATLVASFALSACLPPPNDPVGHRTQLCPLTIAGEACWASATGVLNTTTSAPYDVWTAAQIRNGDAAAQLTHQVGDITITADYTAIRDLYLEGCIAVKAKNVSIQRVYIRTLDRCKGGGNEDAGSAIDNGQNAISTGLQITDVEIDGMNESVDRVGIAGSNWTCNHCNVYGFAKNLWPNSNVAIVDSYSHGTTGNAGATHVDSVFCSGCVNVIVRHNYVTIGGGYVTAGFGIVGNGSDVTADNNFLEGSAYGSGGGWDISGAGIGYYTNLTVTNNRMSPRSKYWSSPFDCTNNTQRGNVNSETGAAIFLPCA